MFANKYLEKQNRQRFIHATPEREVGIIVVIPCYREPDILKTLESLKKCHLPTNKVEVIVVINHSEKDPVSFKEFNKKSKLEIDYWIDQNRATKIRFFTVGPVGLKKKWAGAGLARKYGMDEAIQRFNILQNPEGIIVSLDADTLVDNNYLIEIENYFLDHPKNVGATITFRHQTEELNDRQKEGIGLYEMYMQYYKNALDFVGYPYSMFTLGSAFVVKAGAYVRRGGMNRRKAGEDFYFLQNLVQIGKVGIIETTCVYPSARLSDRVPFGTGPVLRRWMTGDEDLTRTYNFNAFSDLKQFFDQKEYLFKISEKEYLSILKSLARPLQAFLKVDNFWNELNDLNKNCSAVESFQTRFFQKFNAFKILKYLNFVHDKFYNKEDLLIQTEKLNDCIEKK